MRTNWTRRADQTRAQGLIATLRRIEVGDTILIADWTAQQARCHMRSARLGTSKWFEARTLTAGAEILRVE